MNANLDAFSKSFTLRWYKQDKDAVVLIYPHWELRSDVKDVDFDKNSVVSHVVTFKSDVGHDTILGTLSHTVENGKNIAVPSFFLVPLKDDVGDEISQTLATLYIYPYDNYEISDRIEIRLVNSITKPINYLVLGYSQERSFAGNKFFDEKLFNHREFSDLNVGPDLNFDNWRSVKPSNYWASAFGKGDNHIDVAELIFKGEEANLVFSPIIKMGPSTTPLVLDQKPDQYSHFLVETPLRFSIEPPVGFIDAGNIEELSSQILNLYLLHAQLNVLDALNSYGRDASIALSPAASNPAIYTGIRILPVVSCWQYYHDVFKYLFLFILGKLKAEDRLWAHEKNVWLNNRIAKAANKWFGNDKARIILELKPILDQVLEKYAHIGNALAKINFSDEAMLVQAEDALEWVVNEFITASLSTDLAKRVTEGLLNELSLKEPTTGLILRSRNFNYHPDDVFIFQSLGDEDGLPFLPQFDRQTFRFLANDPNVLVATSNKMFALNYEKFESREKNPDTSNAVSKLRSAWQNLVNTKKTSGRSGVVKFQHPEIYTELKVTPPPIDKFFLTNLCVQEKLLSKLPNEPIQIERLNYKDVVLQQMAAKHEIRQWIEKGKYAQIDILNHILQSINPSAPDIAAAPLDMKTYLLLKLLAADQEKIKIYSELLDRCTGKLPSGKLPSSCLFVKNPETLVSVLKPNLT